MRKIYLLMMLIGSMSFGQEVATTSTGKTVELSPNGTYRVLSENTRPKDFNLKLSDFTFESERYRMKDKAFEIYAIDKKLHLFELTAFLSKSQMEEITIKKIEDMILAANEKVTYAVKNKYTYSPKAMRLEYKPSDNEWMIWVDYTAQNDYGATKDSYSFVYFDSKGEFARIVNF